MKESLLQLLIISYAGAGILGVIAYWPTIQDLYHHKSPSANIASYLLWTLSGAITLLYSIFILPDLLFITVSALNFAACAFILYLRIRHKIWRTKQS